MKLDQLRDVVAIIDCAGMRAAARHLHVAQPVIARNLRNLEEEIGGRLFERRAGGLVITALGNVVVDGARRVLEEVRRLSNGIADFRGNAISRGKMSPLALQPPSQATPWDPYRADHVFVDLLLETFRLNGKLLAAGDRLVKPINLTGSRWQVLGSLRSSATVSQIARNMGLQRQSVQRTVNGLRRDGMVDLVENPQHRRSKLAVLTPKGLEAMRQATQLRNPWIKRTTVGITKAELEATYQVMRRIRRGLGDRSGPAS
jgi:DNA-binding MarR family transcriptional regulator